MKYIHPNNLRFAIVAFFFNVFKGYKIGKRVRIFKTKIRCHSFTLGDESKIYDNTIFHDGSVFIGNHSVIRENCDFWAVNGGDIVIGNDVMIAAKCYFVTCDHGTALNGIPMRKQKLCGIKQITVEDDVWIGAHCVILKGVTIHKGAVIGANSTVTRDIPENAIAVGSPAKVIKYREKEF